MQYPAMKHTYALTKLPRTSRALEQTVSLLHRWKINKIIIYFQAQMPDPKTYKQHFENKHPKNDLPEDLKSV